MCLHICCFKYVYNCLIILGGCSRWGKGVIPKVVPPYSFKGLWVVDGLALCSPTPQHSAALVSVFLFEYFMGGGRFGVRGKFLRWFPLTPQRDFRRSAGWQFAIRSRCRYEYFEGDCSMCFEGLGRFGFRGEFLGWLPPYSPKGLLGPTPEHFAIHSAITFYMVLTDRNLL